MDYTLIVIAIIFIILWRNMPTKGVINISPQQLEEMLKQPKKYTVLDVRTESEYRRNHIPGSLNIPIGVHMSAVPTEKPVIIVCQSGIRSRAVSKQLKKLGHQEIYQLRGGLNKLLKENAQ